MSPHPDPVSLTRITVDNGDGLRTWTESFTGRWLAREETAGQACGIALAEDGQLAWWAFARDASDGELVTYPSLEDLEGDIVALAWPPDDGEDQARMEGLAGFRRLVAAAARAL